MPVFNEEKFVGKAIERIIYQSFTDFEFDIIDDGSTDSTNEIIESFTDDISCIFKSPERFGTELNNLVFKYNDQRDFLVRINYVYEMDNETKINLSAKIRNYSQSFCWERIDLEYLKLYWVVLSEQ